MPMKDRKPYDEIQFYREVAPETSSPQNMTGYYLVCEIWMRNWKKINGWEPDCPAIDIRENPAGWNEDIGE